MVPVLVPIVELYRYRYWAGIYDISEICTMSVSISDKYLEITKCGIVEKPPSRRRSVGSVNLLICQVWEIDPRYGPIREPY